jgi:hypothetical protein
MPLAKWQIETLKVLLSRVKFETANFGCPIGDQSGTAIPKNGVDDFIKEKTRLYRETWIIPFIEALINDDKETCALTQPWGRF